MGQPRMSPRLPRPGALLPSVVGCRAAKTEDNPMTLRRLIAMSGAAFLLFATSNVSQAQQTPPPPDRPAATTADDRDRDDMDLGWIGLLGLVGLAGLMGRRDVAVRTTTTRT